MAQEFTINSSAIEEKINQLLPSQGGFGAGVDFSASTMVIPIVDLTESAEGSNVRADLQTALSHTSSTPFSVLNTTTTLVTTTGYFRVFGTATVTKSASSFIEGSFILNDGTTDKKVWQYNVQGTSTDGMMVVQYDFVVFLTSGDSLKCLSPSSEMPFGGSTRQIADVNGNLVNPL